MINVAWLHEAWEGTKRRRETTDRLREDRMLACVS